MFKLRRLVAVDWATITKMDFFEQSLHKPHFLIIDQTKAFSFYPVDSLYKALKKLLQCFVLNTLSSKT